MISVLVLVAPLSLSPGLCQFSVGEYNLLVVLVIYRNQLTVVYSTTILSSRCARIGYYVLLSLVSRDPEVEQ
jgi:hypothetical protein